MLSEEAQTRSCAGINGPEHPSFLVFAFEVIVWRGDITLEREEEDGAVCCAEFVPYAEACKRLVSSIAVPLCDWLTESRNTTPGSVRGLSGNWQSYRDSRYLIEIG